MTVEISNTVQTQSNNLLKQHRLISRDGCANIAKVVSRVPLTVNFWATMLLSCALPNKRHYLASNGGGTNELGRQGAYIGGDGSWWQACFDGNRQRSFLVCGGQRLQQKLVTGVSDRRGNHGSHTTRSKESSPWTQVWPLGRWAIHNTMQRKRKGAPCYAAAVV